MTSPQSTIYHFNKDLQVGKGSKVAFALVSRDKKMKHTCFFWDAEKNGIMWLNNEAVTELMKHLKTFDKFPLTISPVGGFTVYPDTPKQKKWNGLCVFGRGDKVDALSTDCGGTPRKGRFYFFSNEFNRDAVLNYAKK